MEQTSIQWNRTHREALKSTNQKYRSQNRLISFRPNKKAIEKLELLRLDCENDTDLINRIINTYDSSSIGSKP